MSPWPKPGGGAVLKQMHDIFGSPTSGGAVLDTELEASGVIWGRVLGSAVWTRSFSRSAVSPSAGVCGQKGPLCAPGATGCGAWGHRDHRRGPGPGRRGSQRRWPAAPVRERTGRPGRRGPGWALSFAGSAPVVSCRRTARVVTSKSARSRGSGRRPEPPRKPGNALLRPPVDRRGRQSAAQRAPVTAVRPGPATSGTYAGRASAIRAPLTARTSRRTSPG